jgi:hypothetical protein
MKVLCHYGRNMAIWQVGRKMHKAGDHWIIETERHIRVESASALYSDDTGFKFQIGEHLSWRGVCVLLSSSKQMPVNVKMSLCLIN